MEGLRPSFQPSACERELVPVKAETVQSGSAMGQHFRVGVTISKIILLIYISRGYPYSSGEAAGRSCRTSAAEFSALLESSTVDNTVAQKLPLAARTVHRFPIWEMGSAAWSDQRERRMIVLHTLDTDVAVDHPLVVPAIRRLISVRA